MAQRYAVILQRLTKNDIGRAFPARRSILNNIPLCKPHVLEGKSG
jgi:hypothetical protein